MTSPAIRKIITNNSLWNAVIRSLTGVAGGCMPICQGCGDSAQAAAASPAVTSSATPSSTASRTALFLVANSLNRFIVRLLVDPLSAPPVAPRRRPDAAPEWDAVRPYTIQDKAHNRPNLLRQAAASRLWRHQIAAFVGGRARPYCGGQEGVAHDRSRRRRRIVFHPHRHGSSPGRSDRGRGARRHG